MKFALYQVHRSIGKPLLIFALPVGIGSVFLAGRNRLQSLVGIAVAGGTGPILLAAEEVVNLVPRHGVQPTAEGASFRVVLHAVGISRHAAEHVLHQVGGVRVLQPAVPREAIHHWAVQVEELSPRIRISPVAQAGEQGHAGEGRFSHEG